jgi:hypothetical protein
MRSIARRIGLGGGLVAAIALSVPTVGWAQAAKGGKPAGAKVETVISSTSVSVCGAAAALRLAAWPHPAGGTTSPTTVIPSVSHTDRWSILIASFASTGNDFLVGK